MKAGNEKVIKDDFSPVAAADPGERVGGGREWGVLRLDLAVDTWSTEPSIILELSV